MSAATLPKTTRVAPLPAPELPPTASGRKRWTREDCRQLERIGYLHSRYELINGEIVLKMGQNAPHANAVSLVLVWLFSLFGARRVHGQSTMEVRQDDRVTNRPEPDAMVFREPTNETPRGEDVLLVVEVADTSLADDLGYKVGLYARAGIAEYWVLDIQSRRLTVFRNPDTEAGTWADQQQFGERDTVSCAAAPDSRTTVADLLP
ncbi:MAG: Uma2 family endonuclease [Armatimonadaceae bacterium]